MQLMPPPCWVPKRLILVRHGESEGNVNHQIYKSVADSLLHLTETGWEQGLCAGRALKDLIGDEAVKVQVSPYVRTRETFNAIAKAWGPHVHLKWGEDPRLREQDFGNFQNIEEVEKAKKERGRFGPFYYRMPHGESPADVYDRLSSFFESMYRFWDRSSDKLMNLNHLIICHGVTIAVFLMRMFKYSVDDFHRYENFGNAEFCVLERQPNGKFSLDEMYCVKQVLQDDVWQSVRCKRTKRADAGRFDRAINTEPPSQMVQPALEKRKASKRGGSTVIKEFKATSGTGFRCDESNRVETIIEGSQADALGVMRDWFLLKVNHRLVPQGGARQAFRDASATGESYFVTFLVPPPPPSP